VLRRRQIITRPDGQKEEVEEIVTGKVATIFFPPLDIYLTGAFGSMIFRCRSEED
jgi:hypothetical protein